MGAAQLPPLLHVLVPGPIGHWGKGRGGAQTEVGISFSWLPLSFTLLLPPESGPPSPAMNFSRKLSQVPGSGCTLAMR